MLEFHVVLECAILHKELIQCRVRQLLLRAPLSGHHIGGIVGVDCHSRIYITLRGLIGLKLQVYVDVRPGDVMIIGEELLVSEVPQEYGCEVITFSKVEGAVYLGGA